MARAQIILRLWTEAVSAFCTWKSLIFNANYQSVLVISCDM
jgi:hypothetical protein